MTFNLKVAGEKLRQGMYWFLGGSDGKYDPAAEMNGEAPQLMAASRAVPEQPDYASLPKELLPRR